MIAHTSVVFLTALLPTLLLLKGMYAAPLLILVFLLLAWRNRAYLRQAATYEPVRYFLYLSTALLIIPLLSSLWSYAPQPSISSSVLALLSCLMGILSIAYMRRLSAPRYSIRLAYLCGMGFVAVLLLADRWAELSPIIRIARHLHEDYTGYDYIVFSEKNINRGLCALTVLIWPMILSSYQQHYPRLSWLVVLALTTAVLQFNSSSASLGLTAGIASFAALRYMPRHASHLIALGIPLLMLSFPLIAVSGAPYLLSDPVLMEKLPSSYIQRLQIWQLLVEQWQQHPWLGYGVKATRALPLSAESLSAIGLEGSPLHPHNPSIQLLVELGLVGFISIIGTIALLLRRWRRHVFATPYHHATSGAMIVAYAAAGFSSFGIWQIWWISVFWLAAIGWYWAGKPVPSEAR